MKKIAYTLKLISKLLFYKNFKEGFDAIKNQGKPQIL